MAPMRCPRPPTTWPRITTSPAPIRTPSPCAASNDGPRRRPRGVFFATRSRQSRSRNAKGAPVIVDRDEHPRPGTTVEGLATLRGINGPDRTVTAGNASGVNDGSAALLIAERRAAEAHGLTPVAAHPRDGLGGRRTSGHGHRPGRRHAQTAGPAGPDDRGHGCHRAERGLRRAGSGGCCARSAFPTTRRM